MSSRSLMAAAVLSLLTAASHAQTQPAPLCATRARCLDAILDAARDGRQMVQLALTRELQRSYRGQAPAPASGGGLAARLDDGFGVGDPDAVLQALLRNDRDLMPWLPEKRRALALAYLQGNRLADAELELEEALADDPTQAAYWLDLAALYARRGQPGKAVAALVAADGWALDAGALRRAYVQASAQRGAGAPMAPLYARALEALGANAAAQARREAQLAPLPPAKGENGKPAPMPTIVFKDCQPDYPRGALRREETGSLKLAFLVGADGTAEQIRKQASSGYAELDNAALLALSGCRFQPLLAAGKPVAAWAVVQYVWTLE